ncbi:MAG: sulfatase-like hydrolase/transferase [Rubripirellula sp.]
MTHFVSAFRIFCILIPTVFITSITTGSERPNMVVILCDDLGYGDLECYGHPIIKTPHLNRLAESGIRFTDCYSAAPVCSPSRVGLLTGRSPNRAGVYDWIPSAGKPVANKRHLVHMQRHEKTIAHHLRQAGYSTCQVGKWHCNSAFNHPSQPQPGDFGFDHWFATQNNAAPSHADPDNFVRNGKPAGPMRGFSCQIVASEAIEWLENLDQSSPFFLFVAFHEPHEPVASPNAMVESYRPKSTTEDEAQYFANVENMDRAVGRITAALEKLKLDQNTLIFFTSDNGPETLNRYRSANRSYGQSGPLRGMKLHTTEAGFRVAGILNWKNQLPKQLIGSTNSTPISSLDLLPTFCELASTKNPSEPTLDGTNIRPLLRGDMVDRKRPLLWAYYNAINEARVAMRHHQWKVLARLDGGSVKKLTNITEESLPLIRDAELTDIEIYDLDSDITEQKNLAEDRPDLKRKLSKLLTEEYRELVNGSFVW